MTLPNIALLGRLRSGKDTVGDYLADKYGYTRFAFGDELKRDFHRRYPEIPRDPKPRAGYQFHGQFMREHYGENVWVDACFENIEYSRNCPVSGTDAPVVLTDCRQPNEFSALQSASYVLIRVVAPDGLRIQRAVESGDTFEYADLMHGTETALDGYAADFTVVNDAGLTELYAQIDEIMGYLRLPSADYLTLKEAA
ncbi:adenylate kinase [Paenibacillus sp. FSL L8-0340]|uniref:adenylate kinase n=1 Tax=Paenibacillus sp. FSL L8-0340 TaxID=2954685 RepID=UPI0031598381